MLPPYAAPSRQHTTRPMVTGTSVLGIVYDKGVLLAADTLLSYGSMAKDQSQSRLHVISGSGTVIGASGEYSDFQTLTRMLNEQALSETTTTLMDSLYADTSKSMTARNVWNYLRMIMYARRNRMNPYWNDVLVAGQDRDGRPFLGLVDKIGTTVQDNFLATGFGSYLALPLMREKWRPDLTEGEARALLEDCITVLFYRDCRASCKMQLAKCENGLAMVSDPYELETHTWDAPSFVAPVADLDGDGGW